MKKELEANEWSLAYNVRHTERGAFIVLENDDVAIGKFLTEEDARKLYEELGAFLKGEYIE